MIRTYKFRLYPTKQQQEQIHFTLERCRLLYNRLLVERICAYKQNNESLTYYQQKATLPERKKYITGLKQVHSQVLQNVVERLDKSFQAFFRRVKSGEKAGFPRFKPQNRYNSFTYPQSGFAVEGRFLKLCKIGFVRIRLHRHVEGNIKTCSISLKNGRYYACLSCEVETNQLPASEKKIGIDLGVKHLAVTSEHQIFESPQYLRKNEQKLKHLQSAVSKKQRGSKRREKAVQQLARLHEHIALQRKDYAHKVSRQLVNHYQLIAFEDLNVQGMVKKHHLAKSIVDAGWSQLVQFVMYKAESAGRQVVQVNPYNTSQQCSNCGEIVKKSLSERLHRCSCGYVNDRDVNAARNILQMALQKVS